MTPTLFDPTRERGLLVALPHPDDETFSSGGTIARCTDAGVRVTVLCGTYGDMGRRMGRPPIANRESLRDIREAELQRACGILGADLLMLGLRDKCVEFENPDEVAERIATIIRAQRPSSVIGFYPGFGVHVDHDALGLFVQRAVRQLPSNERPRLLVAAIGDRDANIAILGDPDVHSDISAVVERKLTALRAHTSQTQAMFARWETGLSDEQEQAFRERMQNGENYYTLNPDHISAYERTF